MEYWKILICDVPGSQILILIFIFFSFQLKTFSLSNEPLLFLITKVFSDVFR